MTVQALHRQLAEAIGAGESELIPKIFESLVDESEAKVLLAAAPPATVEEIAEKSGIAQSEIESMIQPLFMKGLLFKSKKPDAMRYYRVRTVPQMHDATILYPDVSKETLALWKEYMSQEWPQYMKTIEAFIPKAVMRVIPVNAKLDARSRILAFDDVKTLIDEARHIAVTNCTCRVIDGACGKPLEVCMQLDKAADYALERGTGRQLTKEQAIDMLKMCEEAGLVHVSDNQRSVGHVICNCCSDCCMAWPSVRAGAGKFVLPSRFQAIVDSELCSGCETCLERCFFEALSMEGANDTAAVDADKCMGCGLCIITCPEEALSLKETRSEDFVPA